MAKEMTITLGEGEYALIIGQDGGRMAVRVDGQQPLADETGELPIPAVLAAALAERLLQDPDFHDEMLEWFEEQLESEDEEDSPAHEPN